MDCRKWTVMSAKWPNQRHHFEFNLVWRENQSISMNVGFHQTICHIQEMSRNSLSEPHCCNNDRPQQHNQPNKWNFDAKTQRTKCTKLRKWITQRTHCLISYEHKTFSASQPLSFKTMDLFNVHCSIACNRI